MTRRLKDALDVFFTDIHNSLLSTEYGVDASLPRGSLKAIREALETEPETPPSAETSVERENNGIAVCPQCGRVPTGCLC